jgi:predicted RNA polymerase sigma factor
VHDRATDAAATDWTHISALYELLERVTGNPVVTLNKAVAVGMVSGPAAGLAVVAEVEPQLPDHPRLLAVRAHLHELDGNADAAYADLRAAAALTTNRRERDHLLREGARLRPSRPAAPGWPTTRP